ncbi:Guanine nucleotide-binding protein G(I)/G(S)/G(O) subunit gamma-12 [Mizuhopecten yessoensis]|uniref:Guanine nucleotide-binding protein G(I)/G(S)/G(O) subunit gamma-12 n=1 Tax=Mizuhopecten yessoensis TaxID=6573 RepID=A0A210QK67_MIZYE|nr:Guanine nucleotide-binding protein G(I)/G(S)/G(O) subunit gamma-12 [Mizuhopecten yessoensis]
MVIQNKSDQIVKLSGQVEQLKHHLKLDRLRASRTLNELISFCQQNITGDPLVFPVKENPFKEKKTCSIL